MPSADKKQFSALALAIKKKDRAAAADLLKAGVGPDAFPCNSHGDTLLMRAIADGAGIELIRLLVEHGASLTATSKRGDAVGDFALNPRRDDVIAFLEEKGVAVDLREFSELPRGEKDTRLVRLLHRWDEDSFLDRLSGMLDDGASPNALIAGRTPMIYLLEQGQESPELFECLLEHGADASACPDGQSALHVVAENGADPALTTLLLDAGAEVDQPNEEGRTALHLAAMNDASEESLTLLLERGASVDARDAEGRTPIDVAADDAREFLLSRTSKPVADIDADLIDAAARGDLAKVKALVDAGANPCAVDASGRKYGPGGWKGLAALHAMFLQRGTAVVDYFLSRAGLDWNIRDIRNRTPLHTLCERWHDTQRATYVPKLVAQGADLNARDGDGTTPVWSLLDVYQPSGEIDALEAMVALGAKLDVVNASGASMLDRMRDGLGYFPEMGEKAGFVRLLGHLLEKDIPVASEDRAVLERWLRQKAPQYLGTKAPEPSAVGPEQARFQKLVGTTLAKLAMEDASLELEGTLQPIAFFDWYGLLDAEANDENVHAQQIWEYHIASGEVTKLVEDKAWVPLGVVGMTGAMDSYEEMSTNGTLFLDLARATDTDAFVWWVKTDGERVELESYTALMKTLVA